MNELIKTAFGIYAIRQISTNKRYIGSTALNFYDRWCAHRSTLNRKKHSSIYFQRAWDKYGQDDFVFEVIEIPKNRKILVERELFFINKLRSYDRNFGFNISKEVSPSRLGHGQSSSAKSKISNKLLGIKRTQRTIDKMSRSKLGKHNPMFGKKQSCKTKKKRAKSLFKAVIRSDGNLYDSIAKAALHNNCTYQNISQALRKKCKANGYYWNYKSNL